MDKFSSPIPCHLHVFALVMAVVLATWLTFASTATAKGPVDMITIEGQGLAEPIEITDAESLYAFDPWFRQFIDWKRRRIADPPVVETTYEVSFHLTSRGKIFVLQYSTDPSGGPGYIYIPGPGEPGYRLNIGTIIGGDSDSWNPNGQWQHATPEWGALMQRNIERATSSPTGSGGTSYTLVWALALGVLAFIGAATMVSLRLRRRPA
ncbi:MAG: hypothetical protein OXD46_02215 [Chloroflexi bacterium]|nr:hypothetical protein [Chloroflexota bacterium]